MLFLVLQISKLNRKLSKHEDQMVKEVAEENKHLLKQVEELKKALDSRFLEGKVCFNKKACILIKIVKKKCNFEEHVTLIISHQGSEHL